jgi:AraC-like DNA-binding protein
VFTSGSRSSSAGEKTLSIKDAQDGPRSTIWTLVILCVLRHSPFTDIRSIAEEVGVSSETVHRQLTESLELQPRFLKWVQNFLTHDLKRKCVEISEELLRILRFEDGLSFTGK